MVTISNLTSEKSGRQYLVRYGSLGWVARFESDAIEQSEAFQHKECVLIQTDRGIEIGEVLESTISQSDAINANGKILRSATRHDLEKVREHTQRKNDILDRVILTISKRNLPIEIIDAELLWDGESFICYYLGIDSPVLNLLAHQMSKSWHQTMYFHPIMEPPASSGSCGSGECGCQH